MTPHAFPFRFVDDAQGPGGPVRVRWTAAQHAVRDHDGPSSLLLIEVVAQATLFQARDEPAPMGPVALAGLEELELADTLARRPLRAGDELLVFTEVAARFGQLLKIAGRVERDGETIARGTWLLAAG